jgi:hypothetical protein
MEVLPIMSEGPTPTQESEIQAEQTTYNPEAVLRISAFSTIVAWAFVILAFLILVFGVYTLYSMYSAYSYLPNFLNLVPGVLAFLFLILLCLFFAAQLFASAERLFVLTDIQDNTNAAGRDAEETEQDR